MNIANPIYDTGSKYMMEDNTVAKSVFDQSNRTSDIHILNISEADFPEKFRPVIRRLKGAASDSKIKKQMKEDDEILKYLRIQSLMENRNLKQLK